MNYPQFVIGNPICFQVSVHSQTNIRNQSMFGVRLTTNSATQFIWYVLLKCFSFPPRAMERFKIRVIVTDQDIRKHVIGCEATNSRGT